MTPLLPLLAAAVLSVQPSTPPASPPTPPAPQPATPAPALAPAPPVSPLPASVRNIPYGTFKMELPMIQRNVLAAVPGRLGGMAIDIDNNILYVAGTAANAIAVHNTANSKIIETELDVPAPHSLLFLQSTRTLIASCAADGSCRIFSAAPTGELTPRHTINFSGEAGPLALDAAAGRCWLGHGVFISSFDPADATKKSELSLEKHGRPVALALESRGPHLFAITNTSTDVLVIDRATNTIAAQWPLSEQSPAALALDEANKRLFVACRTRPRLLVLDTTTGKEVAGLDSPAEPGSVCYDPHIRKVYVAGNTGSIGVFAQRSPNDYALIINEPSAPGSRMSLLVPEHRRLLVSCPQVGDEPNARLFIYQIGP